MMYLLLHALTHAVAVYRTQGLLSTLNKTECERDLAIAVHSEQCIVKETQILMPGQYQIVKVIHACSHGEQNVTSSWVYILYTYGEYCIDMGCHLYQMTCTQQPI